MNTQEERRWCAGCQRMVPVEQRFDDSQMTQHGEVTYTVTILDCGHSTATNHRVIAAAPGEPYAPGAARDLRDVARRRARLEDGHVHPAVVGWALWLAFVTVMVLGSLAEGRL